MTSSQIILVVVVTLLFTGSATSASMTGPFYLEITDLNPNLVEANHGDGESPLVFSNIQGQFLQDSLFRLNGMLRQLLFKRTSRLLSYPLLPQAPPALIKYF